MPSYAKFDVWQNTAGVNYGTVLQVVSTTLDTTFTTTTLISAGGAAVTGLSVNITPKYTTSKILVFGHLAAGNAATTQAYYKLKRTISGTTTDVGNGAASSNRVGVIQRTYQNNDNTVQAAAYAYFDSPTTVSQVTYQIYLGAETGTVYLNRTVNDTDNNSYGARGSSSITVMEIAQ